MATSCFILVRNLASELQRIAFPGFSLARIEQGDSSALAAARRNLQCPEIYFGDWILTREYACPDSDIGEDAETLLFLLRLFRPGELCFARLAVSDTSGRLTQYPYRVISPLNSNALLKYRFEERDLDAWVEFRRRIVGADSWSSPWARTCRKFFLYGTSIEFNPNKHELDRLVNYGMALEAALVPEKDFVSARLRHRALALLDWESEEAKMNAKKMLNELYDTRSAIAHGGFVGEKTVQFLQANRIAVESLVHRVLYTSMVRLPAEDAGRKVVLNGLYSVSDDKRADDLVEKFKAIKDLGIRSDALRKLQAISSNGWESVILSEL